ALTKRLRDELDVAPEAETLALLGAGATSPVEDPPPTRYVSGGGVHLAFQTYGAGPVEVLMLPGFVSHVERVWEEPRCRTFLSSLAGMGRLILLDRRGVGLSDRVGFAPSGECAGEDMRTRAAGPPQPARSSRRRAFRPGRVRPQRRSDRRGHRYRA